MALVPGIVLFLHLAGKEENRKRLEHAHNEQHGIRSVDLTKPCHDQNSTATALTASEPKAVTIDVPLRDGTLDARMPIKPITTKHRPETPDTPMYSGAASVPEIAVPPNRPAPATARPNVHMASPVMAATMATSFNIFRELLIASPLFRRKGRIVGPLLQS